jgi:hypothetical protein
MVKKIYENKNNEKKTPLQRGHINAFTSNKSALSRANRSGVIYKAPTVEARKPPH